VTESKGNLTIKYDLKIHCASCGRVVGKYSGERIHITSPLLHEVPAGISYEMKILCDPCMVKEPNVKSKISLP
jgi:hypothetical protein